MITCTSRYHEFSFFMNHLPKFYSIFLEYAWVNKGGFMSYKFRAFFVILRELRLDKLLEFVIAIKVNAIPELRSTIMQEIDRIEVHIFLMPSKHRLPLTNIYIWSIYSLNLLVSKALSIKLLMIWVYVNNESISAKFQGIFASKSDPATSAPYTGALCFNVFQNYRKEIRIK